MFEAGIYFRSQTDHLQKAAGGIQKVFRHLRVTGKNIIGILRPFFGMADKGPLHVKADEIGTAAGVPGGCGIVCAESQNLCKDGGRKREGCGADGGYSVPCLVGGNLLKALGACVTDIESESTVKMNVDETGDDVAAGGVQRKIITSRIFCPGGKEAVGNLNIRLTEF